MIMMKDPRGVHAAQRSWCASRCLRALSAAALSAGLFFAATGDALAQQPPPPPPAASDQHYVVLTNDGSRYEGELVERVVGSHVTIKLVTGDVRTIQAADVKAEWRAGQGPPSVPIAVATPTFTPSIVLPGAALAPGVPLAYSGPDAVTIHLTNASNETGNLFHETASGWEVVCQMPCTTTVDPKTMYKVHNSDAFRFPSGPGSLDLVADIGSRRRMRVIGTWLIVIGASVAPLGGVLAAGIIDDHLETGPTTGDKVGGGLIIAASIGMVVAGITVIAVGPSSTLTTTSGQRIVELPSLHLGRDVALTPTGLVF